MHFAFNNSYRPAFCQLLNEPVKLFIRELIEECFDSASECLECSGLGRFTLHKVVDESVNPICDRVGLEYLGRGISAIDFDNWHNMLCALRCLIKGSKPVSFDMTWKEAAGVSAASRPM